ncbi:MAG TPA: LytTR family DNA-binding domain-containing protein [Chitinophagales bacterium]|jgi:two-component system LytT family response regulator|nr:LytTR family DNA-binding domain-containing protein [Chitinophagales bacterium]
MSLSCLIFDDEAVAIADVSFLIGKYAPDWKIAGIASTISDCKKLLKSKTVDIIFSDIHFGNDIVFELLPELNSFKGDLIFISGDNGYATQAFQLSATSYILKPINETHFMQTLKKYQLPNVERLPAASNDVLFHNLKEEIPAHKKIAFNTSTGYVIKEINDIVYAKSSNNYTEVYFANKEKVFVAKTMLDYEKMLDSFGFFRIHQSYLVNFKYVVRFDTEELELHLTSGEALPVSNRKKTILLEMLRRIF